MKLRELESTLQHVKPFAEPNVALEQYPTSAHLASRVLFAAQSSYGDVEGCTVADLGTGTAMFAIGAAILGANEVHGFDIDPNALRVAVENLDQYDLAGDVQLVCCDVAHLPLPAGRAFDTVFMNPPFGTRTKGIDMVFLEEGYRRCRRAVYSLHKSSTRKHILRKAASWGARAQVLAELRFDVPAMYKFHKKRSKDIEVDLVRLERPSGK